MAIEQRTAEKLTWKQKEILKDIANQIKGFHNIQDNDVTYALEGLITEATHAGTEYFDSAYICQKARIIHEALN